MPAGKDGKLVVTEERDHQQQRRHQQPGRQQHPHLPEQPGDQPEGQGGSGRGHEAALDHGEDAAGDSASRSGS